MNSGLNTVWTYLSELAAEPAIKASLAAVLGGFAALFNLESAAHVSLVWLLCLDYALGVAHALKENTFCMRRACRGLGKFFVYGVGIIIAQKADIGMGLDPRTLASLTTALCAYLSANEAWSCFKHLEAFGFPLPPWLKGKLQHRGEE